jgi:hypothetical protein
MSKFLYRVVRHDFVVSHIEDYVHKNSSLYYEFFTLTQVLGIHTDLNFQKRYWEDCYLNFADKNGIDGILLIPLLLCNGTLKVKLNYIKLYLAVNINHSKDKNASNNLIMNLNIFKKIIYTYIACLTNVACNVLIKSNEINENTFNDDFNIDTIEKNKKNENFNNEIEFYKEIFSEKNIENFTLYLLNPYTIKNFYVNAGQFLDENIEFLSNDKKIRDYILQNIKNINSIIDTENNDLNNSDNFIKDENNNNDEIDKIKTKTSRGTNDFKKTYTIPGNKQ